jgi:hypothetical protein
VALPTRGFWSGFDPSHGSSRAVAPGRRLSDGGAAGAAETREASRPRLRTDRVRAAQVARFGGHGRAVRPDQVGPLLMRQPQSHSDALRSNTPPALSQVPEGQQQPIIDALVIGDGEGNRQRVSAPGGAIEELHAELRPRCASQRAG